MMKARHAVVHNSGVLQLSYDDVKETYHKTKKVISEINKIFSKYPKSNSIQKTT
jgi:hypothetical protein